MLSYDSGLLQEVEKSDLFIILMISILTSNGEKGLNRLEKVSVSVVLRILKEK